MRLSFRQCLRAAIDGTVIIASLSSLGAIAGDPNASALEALRAHPELLSAVKLLRGNGAIFCTLGDKDMVVDNNRTAVLSSPEFQAWHDRGNVTKYTEVRTKAGELLWSMKNGRCSVAVESASNIVALAEGLEQEGMIFQVLPSPFSTAQVAELYARSLGFASDKELLLAEHMRANNEELHAYYKIGISSEAAFDDAVARMRSQGYSQQPADLMVFLKDEAEGTLRNLSAAEIREERNSRP